VSLIPLALENYWHPENVTNEFWDCEEGFCLEEEAPGAEDSNATVAGNGTAHRRLHSALDAALYANVTRVANCRPGHAGLVCGKCLPNWVVQGEFCAPCDPNANIANWSRAKIGSLIFFSALGFLGVSIPFLLWPLFAELRAAKQRPQIPDTPVAAAPEKSGTLAKLYAAHGAKIGAATSALKEFASVSRVPLRMLMENLQIIGSFKRTLGLRWPGLFNKLLQTIAVLQLNVLTIPKAACDTPEGSFYNAFNGITLGLTALLLYMLAVWAVGISIMRHRHWDAARMAAFNRVTVARFITVCTLAYAPVCEKVLSVFSCRKIEDSWYLREDVARRCYNTEHMTYFYLVRCIRAHCDTRPL
jgi:hypothetical protein